MSIVDHSTDEKIYLQVNQKRIDAITARQLKEICMNKIEERVRDIYFDFSNVAYINSSGIGNLLYIRQTLKKNNRKLYIAASTKELRSLFKELLLDNYFIILEDAVQE